jgi:toxin ParE1/3/4
MPTIRLRPRAQDDLIEIWTYVAEDGEAQADALLGSIDQKLQLLAKRPLIGRERNELHPALRSVPVVDMLFSICLTPMGSKWCASCTAGAI